MTRFPYHWIRHEGTGQCTRCGVALTHAGTVCYRIHQDTQERDMIYAGNLEWAKDCIRVAVFCLVLMGHAFAADLSPNGFTATWDPPVDASVQYEFRVTNFALTAPLSLDVRPSMPNTLSFTFTSPLPNVPTIDRWECLEARAVKNGLTSEWVRSCGQVAMGTSAPPPPPPTPPAPKGLVIASQTEMQIVITASSADCPKITTSTAGSTSAKPKRTVTCVK